MTNFPGSVDQFPSAATLASATLGSAIHSKLHGDLGSAVTTIEQWVAPAVNAKALGCKGDDTANDAVLVQFVMQVAANGGWDCKFPKGIYRMDDGTTATRSVVSYLNAAGDTYIRGDGAHQTVFKSHVPLDVANKALIDFTNTSSARAPICEGFSVDGPGTYVNPNTFTKTGTTSGTGTQITAVSGLNQDDVGRSLSGTGIAAGAYIRKIAGTTLTISAALTGAGGAGTTITFNVGDRKVGCGLRITKSAHYHGCTANGWHSGFLTTSEGSAAIDTDHFTITWPSCHTEENVYGHYIQDCTGGTLDFKWHGFRCSRNALAGIAVGANAQIGSSTMDDVHFASQPYAILKEGTWGTIPTDPVFIFGLRVNRLKFEGSGNRVFEDQSGRGLFRGLCGYMEIHQIEINGQQNSAQGPAPAQDHTLREIKVTTMSRSAAGLVTATTSPAMTSEDVGTHIAVGGDVLVSGIGDVANGSSSVTGVTGITAADVGRRIYATGIPNFTIIGAYAAGTITLKDYNGANVNATKTTANAVLTASGYNGCYLVKSVSGTTVTWDTNILAAFAAEAGSVGRIGAARIGSFRASDIEIGYLGDPSTLETSPEWHFDIWDSWDVTLRPTEPINPPVNFPTMNLRTTTAGYNAVKANTVCRQGSIAAWLGMCSAAVTAGYIVRPGTAGTSVQHHAGTKTIPVGGMAIQKGDTVTSVAGYVATRPWIWIQYEGFVDDGHGAGLACSAGTAGKWQVIDAANPGKVKDWDGITQGLLVVAESTANASGGTIPARLVSPFLTVS